MFLILKSVLVFISDLLPILLNRSHHLAVVLLLKLIDDFALSVLDCLGYFLELEAFGFFDAVFNLQFFDQGVHLGQGALVTFLDIEEHFIILRLLCLLLLQLILSSLHLKAAFFTGLFLGQVSYLPFLRIFVDETSFTEHATGFQSRVVVPKFVGYITIT